MSKEPETSVDSQELDHPELPEETSETPAEPVGEEIPTEELPAEQDPERTPLMETQGKSDKILAIKSALKQQEEQRQQEETMLQIADKVKKYKSAKTHLPEQMPEEPVDTEIQPDAAEESLAEEPAESLDALEASAETEEFSADNAEKSEETAEDVQSDDTAEDVQSEETAESESEIPPEPQETVKKKKKKKKAKKSKKKKSKKKKGFSLFPKKGDSILEAVRKCVFLASSAIFVVCLCLIADYFWENYQNAQLSDDLRTMYSMDVSDPEATEPPTEDLGPGYEYYGYLSGAENLLAVNPDVVGWISIPGMDISYPVLQRKGQVDGNDYYLKRNIYGEDAHAGSIFMDYRNDFDYVVDGRKICENSGNLIIYGHNMHDYSMFGSLKHYINYADHYSEHPIVELNSNYRKYKYKIFGMIIVDIDDETDTKFDYWNQLDFPDERAFYDYVNEIKRRTIRLNDVDVKYGDELLTLSTCNSTFSEGRLVVFARKLREDEDLYAGTQTSTENPNIKWPNSYYRWHKNTYDPDAEFVPYG